VSNIKRKLATILATDCVSFSRHMVQDEVATLSALKSCREIIYPIIYEHGGDIFHTAGDSVIAEFSSPVVVRYCRDKVLRRDRCAQREPRDKNKAILAGRNARR